MFYHWNIRCTISVKNSVSFDRECLCTFYRFFVCLAVGRDKLCCLDNINRIFYQISMYRVNKKIQGFNQKFLNVSPYPVRWNMFFDFIDFLKYLWYIIISRGWYMNGLVLVLGLATLCPSVSLSVSYPVMSIDFSNDQKVSAYLRCYYMYL